jgi:hypothetical protein
VFALQLYEAPDFEIIYDGEAINARDAIRTVTSYPIIAGVANGKDISAKLEIVEWKKKVERRLLLCLPGRFNFHSMAPGIHARGFDFTAYLTADLFQEMAEENREGLVELDPAATSLIEAAKAKLREHFREKESERPSGHDRLRDGRAVCPWSRRKDALHDWSRRRENNQHFDFRRAALRTFARTRSAGCGGGEKERGEVWFAAGRDMGRRGRSRSDLKIPLSYSAEDDRKGWLPFHHGRAVARQ